MLIVKFRGLIDKIIQVLSTIIMGVMVIAVCWQVITRYILNNPSTVTEEALRYLLIWVTMVGGAYAYGRRKHLAITALSKRLSFKGQKIGTSGSQSIIGNWATDISSWHTVAWGLLAIGAVAMVLFVLFPMPEVQEHKTEGKVSPKEIMSCPAFLSLVLIIGLYFIAEHGIMNWLVSYATNALEVPMGQAANFTAVFFGCVMVGRLVLSSLVDKLGIYRCLRLFATSAAVLYTAGVLLGAPGLWLLAVSGLLFSILYPTLVMLIPRYWPSHAASSVSGLVLSVASLADILFNAVFGSLVDAIGYRTSFLIMPACMVGCTALLWLFFAKAKKLERCD